LINGLHHISMKCGTSEEFEKAKSFYIGLLGFNVVREWPEGIMLGCGNCQLELFCNGKGVKELGAIRHMAFATDDVDAVAAKVKEAGYEVFIEPKDIVVASVPEFHARMAFCFGPLGEQIEFFKES